MATVFLSYVREDEDRARAIAAHLESAGHSVWWDRHIRGGAQYSDEIEAALRSADKIVVLWSTASVRSPWVRDEAAAGRDSARLVPITLDGAEPPLGFRQFQSVDFSAWHGRGKPARLAALLGAIAPGEPSAAEVRRPDAAKRQIRRIAPMLWIAAAALGLVIVAAFLILRGGSDRRLTTVLVRAAGSDAQSAAVARDLVVRLGAVDAANLSGFRLTSDVDQGQHATFVLEVAAANGAQRATRDLSLLSGPDRSVLWAGHFEQPGNRAADLPAQLGTASALVVKCALEASATRQRLPEDALRLYLTGCSRLEEQFDETANSVTPLFEQVIDRAPSFAAAWDKLLESQAWGVIFTPDAPMAAALARNLKRARQLKIVVPGVYFADAALRPSNDFTGRLGALERGLEQFPDDPALHSTLASVLMMVGRQEDAVQQAMIASDLDPLSPATLSNYIFILAHSGQYDRAREELERAERIWPGTTTVRQARYFVDYRYGDPKSALRLSREGASRWGRGATDSFLHARIDPTPANVARAFEEQLKLNRQRPFLISGLVQTYAIFERPDEALNVMLNFTRLPYAGYSSETFFRPYMRAVWRDPRFMQAMARMGLAAYWQRSGKWPDFCFASDLPYDCRKEATRYLH